MGERSIDPSKIVIFRFSTADRIKVEDFKEGQSVEFTGMIEEGVGLKSDLVGTWYRIEKYPTSFSAFFETEWHGNPYIAEVIVNYQYPNFDAIKLTRDNRPKPTKVPH